MKKPEKDGAGEVAGQDRTAANEIDVPVNQIGQPAQPSSGEAAQEAFEAVLASFNTEEKGRIRQSLNSASTKAEVEAFLKKIQGK